MSGGHFDYIQYRFTDMYEDIEKVISKNGIEKSAEQIKADNPWLDLSDKQQIEWYKYDYNYPKEVIQKFKEGAELIKKAQVYAQRIDWLLSGDDGEESFLKRLKDDLNKLEQK
jgi:hypothetical protein